MVLALFHSRTARRREHILHKQYRNWSAAQTKELQNVQYVEVCIRLFLLLLRSEMINKRYIGSCHFWWRPLIQLDIYSQKVSLNEFPPLNHFRLNKKVVSYRNWARSMFKNPNLVHRIAEWTPSHIVHIDDPFFPRVLLKLLRSAALSSIRRRLEVLA